MTVEDELQRISSMLKTASGSLATFALQTKDKDAKGFYMEASQQLDAINDKLFQRMETVRAEEPPSDTGGPPRLLQRRRPIRKL